MARAVFFNLPAYGHINPTLPLVTALAKQGDEVIYYSTNRFKERIGQSGARFRSYADDTDIDVPVPRNPIHFADLLLSHTELLLPRILDDLKGEKIDYVLHDSICTWGKAAASLLGLPAICSTATFAFTPTIIKRMGQSSGIPGARILSLILREKQSARRVIKLAHRLRKNHGLEIRLSRMVDTFINKSELNIVYTSRALQPYIEEFDDSYVFIGSMVPDEPDIPEPFIQEDRERPLIYISLGTTRSNRLDFYRACMNAFKASPFDVIMSVGRWVEIADLGPVPENFRIYNFVPSQLEAISKASLVIYHAGVSGIHECLYHDVPLLLFPQTMEQEFNARRIQELKAAKVITDTDISGQRIRAMAEAVLTQQDYRARAAQLGASLRSAGGANQGVAAIEAFKKRFGIGNLKISEERNIGQAAT